LVIGPPIAQSSHKHLLPSKKPGKRHIQWKEQIHFNCNGLSPLVTRQGQLVIRCQHGNQRLKTSLTITES
jgi:hypothetical protein